MSTKPEAIRALATAMLSILIEQEQTLGTYEAPIPSANLTAKQAALAEVARKSKNKAKCAKAFGVSRSTLYRWMEST